jgi:hypothetical protein
MHVSDGLLGAAAGRISQPIGNGWCGHSSLMVCPAVLCMVLLRVYSCRVSLTMVLLQLATTKARAAGK